MVRLAGMASSVGRSQLTPQAISNMANALARADLRHLPLLQALGRAVVATPVGKWEMQSACSLANALVRCRYTEPDVMAAIDAALCGIAPGAFSTQVRRNRAF